MLARNAGLLSRARSRPKRGRLVVEPRALPADPAWRIGGL
jgi:hypothetical protein